MALSRATAITQLTTSLVTQVTVTAVSNTVGIVKELLITNINAAARTVDIHFVPSTGTAADSNAIMKGISIPADTMVRLPFETALSASDYIQALANNGTSVNLKVSMVEYGPSPVPLYVPQTPALIGIAASAFYIVGSGKVGNMKEILLSNVTGTDRTVTAYLVPAAGAAGNDNTFLDTVTIAANTLYRPPFNTTLTAGDKVMFLASAASAIMCRISPLEY